MEKLTTGFFVNLLCLGLLSLHRFTLASVILQENPDWYLQERGNIPLNEAGFVDVYERDNIRSVFVTTFSDNCAKNDSVQVLNSAILKHFTPNFMIGGLCHPRSVQKVPDQAFEFPAITISYGNSNVTNDSFGGILLVDVKDFTKPKFDNLISRQSSAEFNNPVWKNKNEFFVCQGKSLPKGLTKWSLKRFGKSNKTPWTTETIVKEGFCDSDIVLYKGSFLKFEVLYAIRKLDQTLNFIWPEKTSRQPGDWTNLGQLKNKTLDKGNFVDIKLVDLNIDGTPDLLLSVSTGEVRAYEIPKDFRAVDKYKLHKLVENFTVSAGRICPFVLKTFNPFTGYKGKPWLLVSGGQCGNAAYLVPKNQSPENWDYKRFTILEASNESLVHGVEAVDIDGDGYTELFISLNDLNIVKVLSLTNLGSTTATARSVASFAVAETKTAAATGSTVGDRVTTNASHSSVASSGHSVNGNSPMFSRLASSLSSPEHDGDDGYGNFTSDSSGSTNAGNDASFKVTSANDDVMPIVSSNNNNASSPLMELESTGTTDSAVVKNTSAAVTVSWSANQNTTGVGTPGYNAGSSSSIPHEVGSTSTDSITASSVNDNRSTVKHTSTIERVISNSPSAEIEGTSTHSDDGMTTATYPKDANKFTSSSFAAAMSDVSVTPTSGNDNKFTVESISTDVRSSTTAAASATTVATSATVATATNSLTPTNANAFTTAASDRATLSSSLTAGDLTTHRCNSTPGSSILDEAGSASTGSSYGLTTATFTDDNSNNSSSSSSAVVGNDVTSYVLSPNVSINTIFSLPSTDDDSSNVTDASSTPDADDDYNFTSPVSMSTSRPGRIHSTTKATTKKSNSGLKSYADRSVFILPVVLYILTGR